MAFTRPVYQHLALSVGAYHRCVIDGKQEWAVNHRKTIQDTIDNNLPSGSGWDCGTSIDLDNSTEDKLIFFGSFHHMDENGMYCGWSEYTVTVTASLAFTLNIEIEGNEETNSEDEVEEELTKDDIHERFELSLREQIEW